LTQTEEETYVWLNPTFMKVLPAKDNPQPATPEELERVWKASGKTRIAPGKAAEKADEEKNCVSCGKPLEYISEYDAWYCSSCGKYDEDYEGDEPPPPE
jgi:hypothetical protein